LPRKEIFREKRNLKEIRRIPELVVTFAETRNLFREKRNSENSGRLFFILKNLSWHCLVVSWRQYSAAVTFAKKDLSATVNLTRWKEERSKGTVTFSCWRTIVDECLAVTHWLSAGLPPEGSCTLVDTPLSRTVLSQGQGQQSYTDNPRVRDKSRGCRQSKTIAHEAIKTTWSTIRGSNTSCFHY
jgi:hypothetical protein